MRKYFIYLIIYSIGGFILERFINLFFLGSFYDNSVLVGPYQPLYGVGILMAIIIYDFFLIHITSKPIKYGLLLVVAIITTAISEAVTGYGMDALYSIQLWDYREFFPLSLRYVGWIPTTLFGIFSFLVIAFLHPFLRKAVNVIPGIFRRLIFRVLLLVFLIDIIYTFFISNRLYE